MKIFISHQSGRFLSLIIPLLFLIIISGCGSDDENNASGPSVVYMWRAASQTDGDLGGVSGANNTCETDSLNITFATSVSNHRAVVATASNDPEAYFSNNPAVKRPDGTDIISTYSDFFDNMATASNSTIGIGWYWTGLNATITNCSDWTSNASGDNGTLGDGSATNATRTLRATDSCDSNHLLLCVSY